MSSASDMHWRPWEAPPEDKDGLPLNCEAGPERLWVTLQSKEYMLSLNSESSSKINNQHCQRNTHRNHLYKQTGHHLEEGTTMTIFVYIVKVFIMQNLPLSMQMFSHVIIYIIFAFIFGQFYIKSRRNCRMAQQGKV